MPTRYKKFPEEISHHIIEKFLSNIKFKKNGCWKWKANLDGDGYGRFIYDSFYYKASRFSYFVFRKQIPFKKNVCHKCDNPACVNPAHLFLGTHKNNVFDRVNKDRSARGSNNGRSKLIEADVEKILAHLANGMAIGLIAKKYSVDSKVILNILRGKLWKHVTYGKLEKIKELRQEGIKLQKPTNAESKLTYKQAYRIRKKYKKGVSVKTLMKKYGIGKTSAYRIIRNEIYVLH